MSDIDWNDEAVETLKIMWAAGNSQSQIASRIPCATRSAIAGKIMRLKLPPRDKGHASPGMGTRVRVRRAKPYLTSSEPARAVAPTIVAKAAAQNWPYRQNPTNSLAEKIAIAEAEPGLSPRLMKGEAPDGTGIQLRELTDLNCHWPRGDPLEDNFEFCGAKALPSLPYCAHHSRIAYAPAQDRRRVQPGA